MAERTVDYELTQHARDAMAKRAIPQEWVERALAAPQWTEGDPVDDVLEHRLMRIPEFGHRVLRVIVNLEAEPPRVVTAYFDRGRSAR